MRCACPLLKTAWAGVCIAALAASCAGRTVPSAPGDPGGGRTTTRTEATPPDAPDCALADRAGPPVGAIGLLDPPNPTNAPVPTNDSERLLFRQIYETLVASDCQGTVRPRLAATWQREPGGTTWTMVLRDDARFTDGTPLRAADVLTAWTDSSSPTGDLRAVVRRHIQAARALDERTLVVTLHETSDGEPLALADPALAITRRPAGAMWPIGTRGLLTTASSTNGRATMVLHPTPAAATADGAPPPAQAAETGGLRVVVAPGRDGRDLLDAGIDLVVTRDPAVLSYAATLAQFEALPLPWTRTYAFVTPENAAPPPLTRDARRALAEDAVRGEARGAEMPPWWQDAARCAAAAGPSPAPALTSTRIVYDESDPVARDLAERIVALAVARRSDALAVVSDLLRSPRTALQATALSAQALATALTRGNEAGYVLALDREPLDACSEMRTLAARAAWIAPTALVPLVDTRLQVVVRRGRAGVEVEGDGTLLIEQAR